MPGAQMGMLNINEMLGKAFGGPPTKNKKLSVADSYEVLVSQEADKLLDEDRIVKEAIDAVENNGIVFLDEIDKITARSERVGADVSREGVQRDLLPLIEGTIVTTKRGNVRTDHILFIASGAFHVAKPADMLPELQGRLPIRVELRALNADDFTRILTEPRASLTEQYSALMATEGVKLEFADEAVRRIAEIAYKVNETTENIGARRLHTVMERLLDVLSFDAPDRSGDSILLDAAYVDKYLDALAGNEDLSRYIL
jgi:ATP-dependent HslUV protease ATP-binding subunit HslU